MILLHKIENLSYFALRHIRVIIYALIAGRRKTVKRISLWIMTFMFVMLGLVTGQATDVSELRWVTRNDSRVPFVRIVLDVNKLPEVDALLSKDGKNLKVTLSKTEGKKLKSSYAMDPQIIKKVTVNQQKKDLVLSIDMPKKIAKKDIKVFPLKKDKEHNKPYRIVIDIPKATPPPTFKTTPGLKGKTIVIDPGHGGSDTGAISANNVYEKDITLPIALHLKPLLEKKGAKVILTRDGDYDVHGPYGSAASELQARIDIAEKYEADVFLSIHIDSFTRPDVGGVSAYYHHKTPFDLLLTEALHEKNLNATKFSDRGVRPANFYLLVNSSMPASLVELGFLSNPKEEAELRKEKVQKAFAKTLAEGLELYFERAGKWS